MESGPVLWSWRIACFTSFFVGVSLRRLIPCFSHVFHSRSCHIELFLKMILNCFRKGIGFDSTLNCWSISTKPNSISLLKKPRPSSDSLDAVSAGAHVIPLSGRPKARADGAPRPSSNVPSSHSRHRWRYHV